MQDSKKLRKDILARRDRIAPEIRDRKSQKIGDSLLALSDIDAAATIFIYVSFRSEVATLPIIAELLKRKKTVTVPLTMTSENRLEIVEITDPARELVPGYCDIPEPTPEHAREFAVDPGRIDLIILPGSVFDTRGGRYGYGGGYYDRLLEQVPGAGRIALAYEVQMVERLELQPHDQLLDRIVTEERLITVDSRNGY